VLRELGDTGLPRPIVLDAVRREIRALRRQGAAPRLQDVVTRIRSALADVRAARIRTVLNGTGIVVHTNLGRAPLGPVVVERLTEVAANYTTVEYALGEGRRGGRGAHLEHALAVLCGAEGATVVNNNAAALVLLVRLYCRPEKNEVVVSRGELVQIGGGFRIPEILESSGARLREVGTTNRTSLADYTRAFGTRTALVLKVHRSNFFMDGFVSSPSTDEIAAAAHKKRLPFVEDLGSGAMFDTGSVAGLDAEPTPATLLRQGCDAVCFSGDKLFGGPQAGIIVGRARVIAAVKREPLWRAFRCDKLTLAALEATASLHLEGGAGVPVVDLLHADLEALSARAAEIVSALAGLPLSAKAGVGRALVGGGALPQSSVPSVTIDLEHATRSPQEMAARLRAQPVPVVGYIARGVLKIDLRTVFPRQDALLVAAIRAAAV
jgi:L-seryl-tRNA(Ser) seleniumtransferase